MENQNSGSCDVICVYNGDLNDAFYGPVPKYQEAFFKILVGYEDIKKPENIEGTKLSENNTSK